MGVLMAVELIAHISLCWDLKAPTLNRPCSPSIKVHLLQGKSFQAPESCWGRQENYRMVGEGATGGCRQAAAGPFWAGMVAFSGVG